MTPAKTGIKSPGRKRMSRIVGQVGADGRGGKSDRYGEREYRIAGEVPTAIEEDRQFWLLHQRAKRAEAAGDLHKMADIQKLLRKRWGEVMGEQNAAGNRILIP